MSLITLFTMLFRVSREMSVWCIDGQMRLCDGSCLFDSHFSSSLQGGGKNLKNDRSELFYSSLHTA